MIPVADLVQPPTDFPRATTERSKIAFVIGQRVRVKNTEAEWAEDFPGLTINRRGGYRTTVADIHGVIRQLAVGRNNFDVQWFGVDVSNEIYVVN